MEKFLKVFLAKPTKFSFFKDILYQFNLFFFVYNGAYYFKIMFQQFSYNFDILCRQSIPICNSFRAENF